MVSTASDAKPGAGRWATAQCEEAECWTRIGRLLRRADYQQIKQQYWLRFLSKLGLSPDAFDGKRVIEIGCGPSGVFRLIQNASRYVLVDPLLDLYREISPFDDSLFECAPIPFEDVQYHQEFDIVLSINSIDHCRDLDVFLDKLKHVTAPSGRVYVAVNTHQSLTSARFWRRFNRFIEPHHPYHYTDAEYQSLLSTRFVIDSVHDVEDEVIWINRQIQAMPGRDTSAPETSAFSRIFRADILGVALVKALAIMGLPQHDFKGVGRSLYRHKAYVCRLPPDAG